MIRTYKRKLILTKAQEERIRSWIGACRVVYNLALEIRIDTYRKTGKTIHKYDLMKQVTDVRKEVSWIKDTCYSALVSSIERMDSAFNTFFKGGGFPKFASKKRLNSIRLKLVETDGRYVKLPKLGMIKMVKDSPISGVPNNAILKIEPTGFFICIQCKDVPVKFESENQAIGLDLGISHFCIDSNGGFIANPRHFKKYERRLRIENRSLARKKKGSNSWKKQAKKLSLLHHKIGNVRKDFLHKESTKIAKSNSVVYMENLNILGMVKNKNLSKHILDSGWGAFKQMISYKTKVVLVDPKYTSQMCNKCGNVNSVNRISQSEFKCKNCGHSANADHNAAKNILSRGTALYH